MTRARRIMIVGNGDVRAEAAAVIDAGDLVIRFNGSRNFGPAGKRTDVVAVCNTGRPGAQMLADPQWRDSEAVSAAREIWSIRDPEKFARLQPVLAVSHPELDDFCDDYTIGFAQFAAARDKQHRVIPGAVHEALDAALSTYRPAPYVVPSSGMLVIQALLSDPKFDDALLVLAGFGHGGWEWHPFDAERQFADHLVQSGRLVRLDTLLQSSLSQGA
ncbi:Urease operon accessory protein [Rhizobium sp. G187]|uniref:Urease operon accessory protein n=1 Tax=Rhizobium sp. G187 TaxID=3451352 RepID=UPI003EE5B42E